MGIQEWCSWVVVAGGLDVLREGFHWRVGIVKLGLRFKGFAAAVYVVQASRGGG